MKVLVIAHDFPPVDSPQALRTAYQVRELKRLGFDVQVLCPAPATPDVAQIHGQADLTIHRTFPGPIAGLVAAVSRRRIAPSLVPGHHPELVGPAASQMPSGLNWKGRLVKGLRQMLDHLLFPGSHAEWLPWARPALDRVVKEFSPDIVLAAHEPAVGLLLGLRAKRKHGVRLVVDLGDPVVTPYTPATWRKRFLELESDVCNEADGVVVTSQHTRMTLVSRHGDVAKNIIVLEQGFDDSSPDHAKPDRTGEATLQLLYTGRFYSFRDPMPLLMAVVETPGVHLTVASPELRADLSDFMARHPDRISFLGKVSHRQAQKLQVEADVLVNIGNAGMCQVPGKFFEYFGAARPILHLSDDDSDEPAMILSRAKRGMVCRSDTASIMASFETLKRLKVEGRMDMAFDLSRDAVAMFGWRRHGERLAEYCRAIAAAAGGRPG